MCWRVNYAGLFAYVLYPNRHSLHIESLAPTASSRVPYVNNLFRYWIFSIYYITSELWGSVSTTGTQTHTRLGTSAPMHIGSQ